MSFLLHLQDTLPLELALRVGSPSGEAMFTHVFRGPHVTSRLDHTKYWRWSVNRECTDSSRLGHSHFGQLGHPATIFRLVATVGCNTALCNVVW